MLFRLFVVTIGMSLPLMVRADERTFRAGAFAQDITPRKFPVSVNGGMQDVQADKANDPLHARCLVLDDGKVKIAIVVCDSCMIPREIMDEAKRLASATTGIPSNRMLISATHSHTCPTVAGVFQSEPNAEYVESLPKMIAEGIKKAHDRLTPARIGWAVGTDPSQVFNRRWFREKEWLPPDPFGGTTDRVQMNPGYQVQGLTKQSGPVDPEVSILATIGKDDRAHALLANYSLHYVGGVPALSADYFAMFADRIGRLLNVGGKEPAFVGIMSNGTSGDVNNVNFAGPAPARREAGQQCRVVADSVAQAAFKAYQRLEPRDWAPLAMAETEIELGVRRPTDEDLKRAENLLRDAPKPLKTMSQVYARETVLISKYPATVKVKLQAIRIGDLGIVAIPCEVFAEIGLEIKKRSPLKPTFAISLANGYNGYLPTKAQHELGGYETWRARSSYLEVDAAGKITSTLLELLEKVR